LYHCFKWKLRATVAHSFFVFESTQLARHYIRTQQQLLPFLFVEFGTFFFLVMPPHSQRAIYSTQVIFFFWFGIHKLAWW